MKISKWSVAVLAIVSALALKALSPSLGLKEEQLAVVPIFLGLFSASALGFVRDRSSKKDPADSGRMLSFLNFFFLFLLIVSFLLFLIYVMPSFFITSPVSPEAI